MAKQKISLKVGGKSYQMTIVLEKGYFNHSLSITICQPWLSR